MKCMLSLVKTRRFFMKIMSGFFILSALFFLPAGKPRQIILATTTSTLDSGLLDELVPAFEKKETCRVKVIAVGTGQAIRLAMDGNADVILVHDRKSEEKFVKEGFGTKRYNVMYNDFIIVGPTNDPAGAAGAKSAIEAMRNISSGAHPFVSRGDNSGTHKKELLLWEKSAGDGEKVEFEKWYIESGAGMEQALRIANEKEAYCLADRSTWLAHLKELSGLRIVFEKDDSLYNPYSVIPVSPSKFPWVNYSLAKKFVEFITGVEGQRIIRECGKEKFGQPLFYPSAVK